MREREREEFDLRIVEKTFFAISFDEKYNFCAQKFQQLSKELKALLSFLLSFFCSLHWNRENCFEHYPFVQNIFDARKKVVSRALFVTWTIANLSYDLCDNVKGKDAIHRIFNFLNSIPNTVPFLHFLMFRLYFLLLRLLLMFETLSFKFRFMKRSVEEGRVLKAIVTELFF